MQIGSVGQTNFKGNSYILTRDAGNNYIKDDVIDGKYTEIDREEEKEEETFTKKHTSFEDAINKAKQNVHPATVFSSVAVMLIAALKGKKAVALARNAAVTLGECFAKGFTTATNKISEKIKKTDLSSSLKASKDKISKNADILRDKGCAKDNKMLDGIQSFTSKILGDKKGESIRTFMEKAEITNPVRIFDALIAATFGISAVDKTSDVVEGALDDYDIKKAKENDTLEAAKELLCELAQ